jgi:ParB-like chromosome segregation protein Spo0J
MLSTKSELADASPTRPWPADRLERWPIERLIPYANNARLHSEADLDKLAAAIRKWGWTTPVLVDEEGNLLAGHGRIAAAPRAGVTSIPVIVARGWSEEEKRAYPLPMARKRAVLTALIERIEVSADQIDIRLRPPGLGALQSTILRWRTPADRRSAAMGCSPGAACGQCRRA